MPHPSSYERGSKTLPIKIPNNLPASAKLREENIFVMAADRAVKQDIRPLKILLLNLMTPRSPRKLSWRGCWATRPCRWKWTC